MNKDWRYEIKFTVDAHEAQAIPAILIEHPAMFRKAYPNRIVNNIYLDTDDMATCFDNLAGISERKKIRVRWYGKPNQIINPILEEKIKNNTLGNEKSFSTKWLEPTRRYHGCNSYQNKLWLWTRPNFAKQL